MASTIPHFFTRIYTAYQDKQTNNSILEFRAMKLLVVEDSPVVCGQLYTISQTGVVASLGYVFGVEACLQTIRIFKPDAVVLDFHSRDEDELVVLKGIISGFSGVKIVTMCEPYCPEYRKESSGESDDWHFVERPEIWKVIERINARLFRCESHENPHPVNESES